MSKPSSSMYRNRLTNSSHGTSGRKAIPNRSSLLSFNVLSEIELTHFEDKDMDWTVKNVIDSKDQMKFKFLLSSRI